MDSTSSSSSSPLIRKSLSSSYEISREDEKRDEWRTIPLMMAHSTTMPHRRHPHYSPARHDSPTGYSKSTGGSSSGTTTATTTTATSPTIHSQQSSNPARRFFVLGGSPRNRPVRLLSPLWSSSSSSSSRYPASTRVLVGGFLTMAIMATLGTYYYLALGIVLDHNSLNGTTMLPPVKKSTPFLRDRLGEPPGRRTIPREALANLQLPPRSSMDVQPRLVTWTVRENNIPVLGGNARILWTASTIQMPRQGIEWRREEEEEEDNDAEAKDKDGAIQQGQVTVVATKNAKLINTTTTLLAVGGFNNDTTNSTTSMILTNNDIMDDEPPEDKADLASGESSHRCVAAEQWQEEVHPNCNTIHEIVLIPHARFLGQGWFRMTWLYDTVVLKMLRLEREYLEEYYELHRRDAVAMDHLTFSPYVMNVYGYCGQSAINELADFKPEINALEQLDRRLRGQHSNNILVLKLRLALSVSIGLYHVHYGIPGMPWEHGNTTRSMRPSMAHYDINPRNIAIVQGGKPKLNDFNIAEFLRYPQENSTADTCGFPSRLHEPWWRAPEEMNINSTTTTTTMVNEKVDIYSLGAVLFHILTTHAPRGKMQKERMEGVRVEVEQGIRPTLMEPFASDPSPIVQAFRDAMDLCFQEDPRKRGTSGEVATILYRAMEVAAEADEKGKHDIHEKPHKKKPHERHA